MGRQCEWKKGSPSERGECCIFDKEHEGRHSFQPSEHFITCPQCKGKGVVNLLTVQEKCPSDK